LILLVRLYSLNIHADTLEELHLGWTLVDPV